MSNDALFSLSGYGVKLSDLISLAALFVSIYVAITSRLATRQTRWREQEREEAKKRLRVEIQDVSYDNEAPSAVRWILLALRCGEDEVEHILENCEMIKPKSPISVKYNGKLIEDGYDYGRVNFPDDTLVGMDRSICLVTEHSLPNVSLPGHIRFRSIRRDSTHSRSVVDVKVPVGRAWFGHAKQS